jgi:periplasmic protein TonB
MKIKKSKRANLENKRLLFLQIGLVISLFLILMAFEWTTEKSYSVEKLFSNTNSEVEEIVKITVQEDKKPVIPIPKAQPVNFSIKENDQKVDEIEIHFAYPEDTENSLDLFNIYEPDEVIEEPTIFKVVEEFPSFPGGLASLQKYLIDNLKYPKPAVEAGITGTVYVNFIVWADGSIRNAKIERGIGGGCDEAALRVVNDMPDWIPGKQRTVPVNVQMVLPVKFQLN